MNEDIIFNKSTLQNVYQYAIYLHERDLDNKPVLDTDLGISIDVESRGPYVTLDIPEYQFHLPVDGYLDTLSDPLPEWIWPRDERFIQYYPIVSLDTNLSLSIHSSRSAMDTFVLLVPKKRLFLRGTLLILFTYELYEKSCP